MKRQAPIKVKLNVIGARHGTAIILVATLCIMLVIHRDGEFQPTTIRSQNKSRDCRDPAPKKSQAFPGFFLKYPISLIQCSLSSQN